MVRRDAAQPFLTTSGGNQGDFRRRRKALAGTNLRTDGFPASVTLQTFIVDFGSADVNPPNAEISGPKSLVLGAQVQAKVSLTNVRSGATLHAKVEVLDRTGTPITEDRVDRSPREVEVTPNLTPAKPRRTLLLSPTYSGKPEPGYHVTRVEFSIHEVKVQGDRSKIAGLTVLETEPISLAGRCAPTPPTSGGECLHDR